MIIGKQRILVGSSTFDFMMLEYNTSIEISNPFGSYCKMLLDPILQIRLQDSDRIPIGFVSHPIGSDIGLNHLRLHLSFTQRQTNLSRR